MSDWAELPTQSVPCLFILLKWELGMDAPKFAFCKAVAIMLQKIELCKGQSWCYVRNFS